MGIFLDNRPQEIRRSKKNCCTARGIQPWKIPVYFFQQIDLALEMASSIPW